MKKNVKNSILLNIRFITILTFICLLSINVNSQVQSPFKDFVTIPGVNPPFITDDIFIPVRTVNSYTKKPGHYSRLDWQQRIDSTWGPGLPTATKLVIFDKFWREIDSAFACFHNLPLNWDSLRSLYRPQIEAGVSRGRFSAIISHLAMLLKEPHTTAFDIDVSNTPMLPGVPLFNINGWLNSGPFGAGLSPLPDSSLLVYDVIPNHPLGLQRGDIILGYDRIPWKILYKQLIEFQLPLRNPWYDGSPSSYTHTMLICAGRNWHLFDTIDVVKYPGGDTLHLSTTPLINQNLNLFNTEQMDFGGVPKPNYPSQVCSFGVVNNTNIGYIYVWGWINNASSEFYNAVQSLMQTDGLIIDFRFNVGGNMWFSNPGLSLLFDTTVATIDLGKRCSPQNHQQMCPMNVQSNYIIPGSPPGYNKPIAVLTGPGAVSSGDQVALRLKYHKHARFFGKSTSTAFNSPVTVNLHNQWFFWNATADSYKLSNPNEYLTHKEFEVDSNIWLSQAMVAQGRDDVVEAAIAWINKVIGISKISSEVPLNFNLSQNYPNPFNPSTKINFSIPNQNAGESLPVKLIIYDILGREVAALVNGKLNAGTYEAIWDAKNSSSGVYFYRLKAGDFSQTKKMILTK